MISEEDCIHALREAAQLLGESPTKAQYEELDLTPSASTILRHCDGWNEAKEAAGLETNPSTGSRVQPKPEDVELPDGMVWEELSQNQRWHYRHRPTNCEWSLERRQELRRWLHRYKLDSDGCVRCDESDPACLDFHHGEGVEKEMDVNKMVPYGYPKAEIRAEIEKCDLLCANCHRREHHAQLAWLDAIDTDIEEISIDLESDAETAIAALERQGLTKDQRLRLWTRAYKRERGCQRCGERDPVCLQFHHVGEKSDGVGAMIADSKPVEAVVAEVEQCRVLCANCHRKEHYQHPIAEESDRS